MDRAILAATRPDYAQVLLELELPTVEAAILLAADDAFELHLLGREKALFFSTPENAKAVMVT